MNPLREAAQQALERLRKYHYGNGFAEDAECIADLEAALAQQAEPDHETRAELAEQQVAQLAKERDHYRNLWQKAQQAEPVEPHRWEGDNNIESPFNACMHKTYCMTLKQAGLRESRAFTKGWCLRMAQIEMDAGAEFEIGPALAQQAEPLNLRDPAIQKRLAAQWGYVPAAAQAEPVAQFDLNTMPGQADAHLRALLRYTETFYATAIEHGMRAGPTANAIAHVERAGKALHQIVHAQAKMLEPAQPVEPVAWVNQANLASARLTRDRGGQGDTHTWSETRSNYHGVPLYTAPPQRKPLTAQQLDGVIELHVGGSEITDDEYASMEQFVRAVEKAVWEKNHGQA